jgi:tripartite-type tricarboxylate transporter receptor subunit TctC
MGTITRRNFLGLGLGAGTLLASGAPLAQSGAQSGAAADWPARPVRFIIPFPPGGGGDVVARAVAEKLSPLLGQTVIIDNRTGGNAVIAATAVLQPPQDGYSYLWDGNNQISNPLLIKDIPFDYRTAFVPVAMTARFPQVIAVRADFPARTFEAFLEYVRANPGKVSCGTPPSGGMGHLALELLKRRANLDIIHTPYRGGPDATRDIMGGQIDSVLLTTSTILPALQTNKARILAVTSAQRLALYPDVPTIAERGFPGYDMDDWNGLFVGANAPSAHLGRLHAAIGQACRDPELVAKMQPRGTILVSPSQAEFRTWLATQREVVEKVIRDANITLS